MAMLVCAVLLSVLGLSMGSAIHCYPKALPDLNLTELCDIEFWNHCFSEPSPCVNTFFTKNCDGQILFAERALGVDPVCGVVAPEDCDSTEARYIYRVDTEYGCVEQIIWVLASFPDGCDGTCYVLWAPEKRLVEVICPQKSYPPEQDACLEEHKRVVFAELEASCGPSLYQCIKSDNSQCLDYVEDCGNDEEVVVIEEVEEEEIVLLDEEDDNEDAHDGDDDK